MKETVCDTGCPRAEKARKKAYVTLYRDELLYEVKNIAFVVGDVREEKTETHTTHQVQDVGEDGNVDRVTRIMDLCWSRCCNELYPWAKSDFVCGTERDDILKERPFYRVRLLVPVDFGEPSLTYLERLMHEYIVDMVLFDWFTIAAPEKAEAWGAKASLMAEEMKGALVGRLGRARKGQHPF